MTLPTFLFKWIKHYINISMLISMSDVSIHIGIVGRRIAIFKLIHSFSKVRVEVT